MDFLERFRRYIKHQNLPIFDGPILLAVSGGIDSMVMLHLFSTLDLPFGVAHCHFQLRGQASDEDAAFVQQIASKLERAFFVKRFETKAYAEKNGISTQMSARILRYEWFAEMATAHGFSGIATAHHLNDSIETVLLNFIRGTGIAGMTGIRNAECGVWSAECGIVLGIMALIGRVHFGKGNVRPCTPWYSAFQTPLSAFHNFQHGLFPFANHN